VAPGGSVVYFGSDSAITHALLNFPTAREYHLVDIWGGEAGGRGRSPQEKFNTIRNTLAAIDPSARVEITDNGFTSLFTPVQLGTFRAFRARAAALAADPGIQRPLVMRVRWTSPSQGRQERIIYINYADILDPEQLTRFLNRFPERGISGGLFRGTPLPQPTGLRQILGRMDPSGILVSDSLNYGPFLNLAETNPVTYVPTSEANFLVHPNP
jgi:hypothetical protein